MSPILLYVTVKDKPEALRLAETLLAEGLVACANILPPMTSLYRWEGALQQEEEVLLLAKTSPAVRDRAIARIGELHGYDCPCILAFEASGASAPFAEWIFSQIRD